MRKVQESASSGRGARQWQAGASRRSSGLGAQELALAHQESAAASLVLFCLQHLQRESGVTVPQVVPTGLGGGVVH